MKFPVVLKSISFLQLSSGSRRLSSQIPSLGALCPLALGSISPVRNPGAELRSRKLWALLQVGTELAAGSSSSGFHLPMESCFLCGPRSHWVAPFDSPTPQILSGLPPNTPSFPNLARNCLTTWQDVCLSVWTLGRWCCPEASLVSREQTLRLGADNKFSRLISSAW